MEFLAILLITAGAIAGATFAINFFWQTGLRKAAGIASFFVAIFLIFWLSGLWQDSTRHAWGYLTPLFMLMIVVGWLLIHFAKKFLKIYGEKDKKDDDEQP